MPAFRKLDGFQAEFDTVEGISNIPMWAETYAAQGGHTPAGTRLFVGTFSMNPSSSGPAVDDQVLVVFEQSRGGTHPDFLWAPHWML